MAVWSHSNAKNGWPDASDPIDPVSTYAHSVSRSCCCEGLWAYPSGRRNPIRAFLTYTRYQMACFSCIEGLAIGQPAAAWGPGFSPSQVVKISPGPDQRCQEREPALFELQPDEEPISERGWNRLAGKHEIRGGDRDEWNFATQRCCQRTRDRQPGCERSCAERGRASCRPRAVSGCSIHVPVRVPGRPGRQWYRTLPAVPRRVLNHN